jgi:hypothetical protein
MAQLATSLIWGRLAKVTNSPKLGIQLFDPEHHNEPGAGNHARNDDEEGLYCLP